VPATFAVTGITSWAALDFLILSVCVGPPLGASGNRPTAALVVTLVVVPKEHVDWSITL
jgi:hypothetical protein